LKQRIDERSGLSYDALLKGDVPDDSYWDYIKPQREYLRATYGKDISTTIISLQSVTTLKLI
jgi:hypothetical protein